MDQETNEAFDQFVRRIVRDELATIFRGQSAPRESQTRILGTQATDSEGVRSGAVRRRRRSGSGQVQNPRTDKRLKANRTLNA